METEENQKQVLEALKTCIEGFNANDFQKSLDAAKKQLAVETAKQAAKHSAIREIEELIESLTTVFAGAGAQTRKALVRRKIESLITTNTADPDFQQQLQIWLSGNPQQHHLFPKSVTQGAIGGNLTATEQADEAGIMKDENPESKPKPSKNNKKSNFKKSLGKKLEAIAKDAKNFGCADQEDRLRSLYEKASQLGATEAFHSKLNGLAAKGIDQTVIDEMKGLIAEPEEETAARGGPEKGVSTLVAATARMFPPAKPEAEGAATSSMLCLDSPCGLLQGSPDYARKAR